jgi:hypothetical protein
MMLVSIVGQASFQTVSRNGPSMMERSYRPAAGARGAGASGAGGVARVASVNDSSQGDDQKGCGVVPTAVGRLQP